MQVAGLLLLISAVVFGFLSSLNYSIGAGIESYFPFDRLRPLHVSGAVFFILLSAIGTVFRCYREHTGVPLKKIKLLRFLFIILLTNIVVINICYVTGNFGGREYWEFPPVLGIPLMLTWLGMLYVFIKNIATIKKQPVYVWMWITGFTALAFTFMESYLWTIPWFRSNIIQDMTIQWKSNGSMVGSWNMMIYGAGIYIMDRISGNDITSKSKLAFGLYFLGLFNLMFNWGHHIYTLPTHSMIKHIGYLVSMTELLILGRIIYTWKSSVREMGELHSIGAYRFIASANIWIFLNLALAIMISVPAVNVLTHGTMITVAHAMGATIGINSMMLFAFMEYFRNQNQANQPDNKSIRRYHLTANIALVIFWLSLIAAGIVRSNWQMSDVRSSFGDMMIQSKPFLIIFGITGTLLMLALSLIAGKFIKSLIKSDTANNLYK